MRWEIVCSKSIFFPFLCDPCPHEQWTAVLSLFVLHRGSLDSLNIWMNPISFTVRTGKEWALAEESFLFCLITESQFCAGEITSSEPLRLKRYFISLCSEIDNECQLVPGGICCCNRNSFSDRNCNDSRRVLPWLGSPGIMYNNGFALAECLELL